VFRRITVGRADRARLVALVCAGFLLAWVGFGVLAYALDVGVRQLVARSDWIVRHGWALGALVLAGAGLFQFSKLKYRCLEQCQSPFMFVAARWHGRAPAAEALRLGLDHGVFCVGCCWALMLVTFVVGMGSLAWMLALAALMAAEKNLPWGRRLRAPLGFGLLAAAAGLAAANF
jgi:predicted metal-binding membrane protein